ncbi:uncharacterized protein LOC116302528 [Actinia tenebrosa]|uniref:Uncharacterized protein LOC116302528 n=1 Tax=Actinia tenebrosa TaxID=6105 RepID=A0A6P8IM94_ACTTE|nr:uncharacterized protein LOC116302528 [Actinia tenebrosa]
MRTTMVLAVLILLFLYCKTDLVFVDGANSSTPLLITPSPNIPYNITQHPASGKTSFVINPTKTTSNDHSQMTTITSSLLMMISVSPSISIDTKNTTGIGNDEGTTANSKTALYWGIGGGVGSLALISIGILVCGCFSKYKSQHRVDVSSENTSDMPLGDCPSWRHVNVKHPLSSRITERTEHSSSYN